MYCSGDDLPYLSDQYRITFPEPDPLDEYGIVMVGGNLSPGILLSAYEQGSSPGSIPISPSCGGTLPGDASCSRETTTSPIP